MTLGNPLPPTGRLAPSPTGGLHLGHARTSLVAWVAAKSLGGRIVLRIEDLDAGRVRPEAISSIMEDLNWLGLGWDEGPYVQSSRKETYQRALDVLRERNLVYPCTCTRADVARAASAPHAEDEGPVYPGTCSCRSASDASSLGDPHAWRFRVPKGAIAWHDQFRGATEIDPSRHGGDFVVARSDGSFSYQLAVVVDDASMHVTQVVRGDDLVSSTPRQLLLYDALSLKSPSFAHLPLAVGPDGKRLAKRDGSIKLATLRAEKVNPRVLIGRLAQSCQWSDRLIESEPADWLKTPRPLNFSAAPWVVSRADSPYFPSP